MVMLSPSPTPIWENVLSPAVALRLSNGNMKKLEYAAEILGLTKAEIIRQGIDLIYEKAQKEAQK